MSLTAWLNPTSLGSGTSGRTPVYSFGSGTNGVASTSSPYTAMYFYNSVSDLMIEAALSATTTMTLLCANTGITLGKYVHVGVTLQKGCAPLSSCSASVSVVVYINGVVKSCLPVISKTSSTMGAAWRTSAFLGQSQNSLDGRYAGYIGDMQARALSAICTCV